ncbi:MAG: hypothetical protein UR30_C0005G0006 [Candidatus Peregrinibacteria bacterium GW2011_GWC2_33_13]|nr:MAG: hypothetical protein UR30_C0005G0006 [Candidatus Peregrinibacteria bacterium GW2011_GWC2_33_13]
MSDIELQQKTNPYIRLDLRFFKGLIFAIFLSILIFLTEVLVISVVIKFIFGFAFWHVIINTFIVLALLYIIAVFIFLISGFQLVFKL